MEKNQKDMKENTNEGKTFTINRINFFIAVVTLITVGIGAYQSYQNNKKLGLLNVAIRDTNEIRKALNKPLEGIWDTSLIYNKFFEQEGEWELHGTTVIKWQPDRLSYYILTGASLRELGGENISLATFWIEGYLQADRNGKVNEFFDVELEYKGLNGLEDYNSPGNVKSKIQALNIVKEIDGYPLEIKGQFDERGSFANVSLRRVSF